MAIQQFFTPWDSSTLANYYAWANGLSGAIVASGWTRITTGQDPGVVVWANVASALSTYTSASGQIPSEAPRPTIVNSGAGVTTIGAWSSSSVVYVGLSASTVTGTASVVTYNGLTWICIQNNTSSGSTTPGTSGGSTYWLPYIYEIFASNDTLTSSCPIYLKIVYSCYGSAAFQPGLNVGVATSYSGNALLSGNIFNVSSNSGEVWTGINGSTAVTTPVEWDVCSNGQGGVGNISIITGRGAYGLNSQTSQPQVIVIDRAKNNNGLDNGAFFVASVSGATNYYQLIFAPATGGRLPATSAANVPTIFTASQSSGAYQGQAPVYPVFPITGYVANPMLGMATMSVNDANDGSLIQVVMYGGSHQFIVTKGTNPSNLAGSSTYYCALLRFE